MMTGTLTINGRDYPWPKRPAVVICLDGCEPEYLDRAIEDGLMPNLSRMIANGSRAEALSAMPSFTNPNNMSIATGRPPAIHGICGNYFLNPETGEEVMMNDARFLRAPTIFAGFFDAGARVAILTAKDKLRALLGTGLGFDDGRAICFSAEKADLTTQADHGVDAASDWLGLPVPEVYSAALSEFVFAAGVRLLTEFRPDLMYLTTTDFIQHKYPPGHDIANAFYASFDRYLPGLEATGAAIVITADHGMKPKHHPDGGPAVIYLQEMLDDWLGAGAARVILPITDPYVVHHGAFGAFATVYLSDPMQAAEIAGRVRELSGIGDVLTRQEAEKRFELPGDRIGDLVVTSVAGRAIGTREAEHDLSALDAPLRSHGGRQEQSVPFISNVPIGPHPEALRNFDAFHVALMAASEG